MVVTDTNLCDFFVWTNKKWHLENIKFGKEFWIVQIQEEAKLFFSRVIMPKLVSKYHTQQQQSDSENYFVTMEHSYSARV